MVDVCECFRKGVKKKTKQTGEVIFNLKFLSNCLFSPWNGWKTANINEFTQLMRGLLKVTQSSNDVSTPEISRNDLQVKWKMYKYLWTSFPALVCWSLKESNLVVVIVFSPQNLIMAPAEYTASSLLFSLFQWGNLSLLIINRKIIPSDGHQPRTPCLPH